MSPRVIVELRVRFMIELRVDRCRFGHWGTDSISEEVAAAACPAVRTELGAGGRTQQDKLTQQDNSNMVFTELRKSK